jgi:hypothetical protein
MNIMGALENMIYIQKCWVETSLEIEAGKTTGPTHPISGRPVQG